MSRAPVTAGPLRSAALACLLLLASCTGTKVVTGVRSEPSLDAVLWMRTSAEWEASTRQTYRLAVALVNAALEPENASWSAALEQKGPVAGLPPAVIVDVDEALLDNSEFEVTLIEGQRDFDLALWKAWVRREEAVPIPGAVEFATHAKEHGVTVFYVSNREYDVEGSTVANLSKHGFPVEADGSNVLSKDERPEWGSNKTTRRAHVVQTHRVILMVGDDLNDFVQGSKTDPAARQALARKYSDWWGSRWVLLPNPAYGDWERALYEFDPSLTREEILRRKYEALDAALH